MKLEKYEKYLYKVSPIYKTEVKVGYSSIPFKVYFAIRIPREVTNKQLLGELAGRWTKEKTTLDLIFGYEFPFEDENVLFHSSTTVWLKDEERLAKELEARTGMSFPEIKKFLSKAFLEFICDKFKKGEI